MEQLEIVSAMKQLQLKERVTYVLLAIIIIAFIFLMLSFFMDVSVETRIITAAFDVLLSPTAYLMCRHYFPASRAAKKADR